MIVRRHLRTAAATVALLLCGSLLHAGTVIDLASESAPTIYGDSAEGQFGYCTAIGDLNGDGEPELVVGAPGLADSITGAHAGGVFVFRLFCRLDTLVGEGRAWNLSQRTISRGSGHGRFGSALAVADLDADGFDDLAVAAPAASGENSIAHGEVSVYFGGPSGSDGNGPDAGAWVVLTGATAGARLGSSLLARDLDGDGAAELLISEPGGGGPGSPRHGAVHVIEGASLRSLSGPATASEAAMATIVGEHTGDGLAGLGVADTDGDGGLELVLGASLADGSGGGLADVGKLYVIPWSDVPGPSAEPFSLTGAHALHGISERGLFGRAISVGDLDLDGVDDLLVSAYGSKADRNKLEATGEAFLLFGKTHGDDGGVGAPALGDPSVPRFVGRSRSAMLGLELLLADFNGDGADDVIVASQFADGPGNDRNACGEISLYRGSLKSVMEAKSGDAERADVTVIGEFAEDSIGGSLLLAKMTTGGPPVLLVGAPDASSRTDDGEAIYRRGKLILLPGSLLVR